MSDIDDFVQHGFNIPPAEYDEVQKIGKARLWKLEKLKAPLDSEDQAIVDARVDMVKHRSLEDVKWLKHKAYYRAMEKIRAEKAAEDKAHREEYLASKGAPLDVVPAAVIDAPSPMQQAAQAQAAAGRSAAAAGAAEAVPEDISRFYKPVGANVAEPAECTRAAATQCCPAISPFYSLCCAAPPSSRNRARLCHYTAACPSPLNPPPRLTHPHPHPPTPTTAPTPTPTATLCPHPHPTHPHPAPTTAGSCSTPSTWHVTPTRAGQARTRGQPSLPLIPARSRS